LQAEGGKIEVVSKQLCPCQSLLVYQFLALAPMLGNLASFSFCSHDVTPFAHKKRKQLETDRKLENQWKISCATRGCNSMFQVCCSFTCL